VLLPRFQCRTNKSSGDGQDSYTDGEGNAAAFEERIDHYVFLHLLDLWISPLCNHQNAMHAA
jgi:hypothetical protein